MMKTKNKMGKSRKAILITTLVCVIAGTGIWFFSICKKLAYREQSCNIPLFIEYGDDVCYLDDNGYLTEYWSEEWEQYIVDLDSQLYEIESISIEYAVPCVHPVLFVDEERRVIKKEELEAGKYTLEIPDKTALVCIPLKAEEEGRVRLRGELSERGKLEKEREQISETRFYGKKMSVLGDSISAMPVYQPTGCHMYPDPEVKSTDFWWYRLAQRLGMTICKVNAFGGSGVTDLTVTAKDRAAGMGRGKELHIAGENPDIILVLIGGNDIYSDVPRDKISEGYRRMMDDITETYPKAELYVCTYYNCNLFLVDTERWLNQEIRAVAEEYHVGVIDLELSGISMENQQQYLVDGTHPNKKGFQLLGAWAAEELLKK